MIFNLVSVIYWRVITAGKHQQVDINNVQENARKGTHDYAIGDIVYVEINGIYHKLDYNKQVKYIITQVFKNGTVKVKQGQVNKRINIRRLMPHFTKKANHCP